MKPRRLILIGVVALLALGAVWFVTQPREPRWQGRTMADWFETAVQEECVAPQQLPPSNVKYQSPGTARRAFQEFGTNAIPFLLQKLVPQHQAKRTKIQSLVFKFRSWLPQPIVAHFLVSPFPRFEDRAAAVMLAAMALRHTEAADMLMETLLRATTPASIRATYYHTFPIRFRYGGGGLTVSPGELLVGAIIEVLAEGQFQHPKLAPALLNCAALGNPALSDEVEQAWGKSSVRASLEQSVPDFTAALNAPDTRIQEAAAIALGLWLLELEPTRSGSRSAPKADPIRIARYRELFQRHQIPDDRLIEVLIGTVASSWNSNAQNILGHLAPINDRVVEGLVYRLSIASPGQVSWIGISLSSLGLSAVPALPTLTTFRETTASNSLVAASLPQKRNRTPVSTVPYDPVRSIAKATSDARLSLLKRAYASMNNLPETASPKVRAAVAKATANWPQDLVRELVYRFSLDDSTAWSAMRELEKLGPTIVSAALPDLRAALKHPNDRVRAQAAATIAEAGPAAMLALPELKTLAESEAPNVRETIEKAIQKIEAAVK